MIQPKPASVANFQVLKHVENYNPWPNLCLPYFKIDKTWESSNTYNTFMNNIGMLHENFVKAQKLNILSFNIRQNYVALQLSITYLSDLYIFEMNLKML